MTYTSTINENDSVFLSGYAFDKTDLSNPSLAQTNLAAFNSALLAQNAGYQYVDAGLSKVGGLGFYATVLEKVSITDGSIQAVVIANRQTRVTSGPLVGTAADSTADTLNMLGVSNGYASSAQAFADQVWEQYGTQNIPVVSVGQSGGAIGAQLETAEIQSKYGLQSAGINSFVTLAAPFDSWIIKNQTGVDPSTITGVNFDHTDDLITGNNSVLDLPTSILSALSGSPALSLAYAAVLLGYPDSPLAYNYQNYAGQQVFLSPSTGSLNFEASNPLNDVSVPRSIYDHFVPSFSLTDLHAAITGSSGSPVSIPTSNSSDIFINPTSNGGETITISGTDAPYAAGLFANAMLMSNPLGYTNSIIPSATGTPSSLTLSIDNSSNITKGIIVDTDNKTISNFFNPGQNNSLAAQQLQNADGSGLVSANDQILSYDSGVVTSVTVGSSGTVNAAFTSASNNSALATIGLSANGVTLSDGTNFFANYLNSITSTSVDASGNVTMTSPRLSGTGNDTLDFLSGGTDASFVTGDITFRFNPAEVNSVTSSDGQNYQFGLGGLPAGSYGALTYDPINTVLNFVYTPPGGQTVTAPFSLDAGDTVNVTSTHGAIGVQAVNASGQPTSSITPTADGGWVSNMQNTTGVGPMARSVNTFDNTGALTNSVIYLSDGSHNEVAYDGEGGFTTNGYNSSNQLVTVTEGVVNGAFTRSIYDPDTQSLIMRASFDDSGKLTSTFDIDSRATQVQLAAAAFDFIAGQVIGQFLGNNNLPSIAAQAFSNASVETLSQAITGLTPVDASTFASDYANSFLTMGAGVGGSLLGSQIDEALNLPLPIASVGFGALTSATMGYVSANVAKDILHVSSGFGLIPGENGAPPTVPDFTTFLDNAFAGAGGSFLASELASLLGIQGTNAEIGGAAAAAAATAIVSLEFPGLDALYIFGIAFGSNFIGEAVGALFGDGYRGRPLSIANVGVRNGLFTETYEAVDNNGDVQIARTMAAGTSGMLNNIVTNIGGTPVNTTYWQVGGLETQYTSQPDTTNQAPVQDQFSDPSDAVANAVMSILRHTQFVGGDPYKTYLLEYQLASNPANDMAALNSLIDLLNVGGTYSASINQPLVLAVTLATATPDVYARLMAQLSEAPALGLDKLTVATDGRLIYTNTFADFQTHQSVVNQIAGKGLIETINITNNPDGGSTAYHYNTAGQLTDWTTLLAGGSTIQANYAYNPITGVQSYEVVTRNASNTVTHDFVMNADGTSRDTSYIDANHYNTTYYFIGHTENDAVQLNLDGTWDLFVTNLDTNQPGSAWHTASYVYAANGAILSRVQTNFDGTSVQTYNANNQTVNVGSYGTVTVNGSNNIITGGSYDNITLVGLNNAVAVNQSTVNIAGTYNMGYSVSGIGDTLNGATITQSNLYAGSQGAVIGSGVNSTGGGGTDIFTRNTSNNQISAFEFNSSGQLIGFDRLNSSGGPFTRDIYSRVVGTGTGLIATGEHDVFTRESNGQIVGWEFNNAGFMTWCSAFVSSGGPFTLDTSTPIVGAGQNFINSGGHDLFTVASNGQVVGWEFNDSGFMTWCSALTYYGSPFTRAPTTDVLGTGTSLVNSGGHDLFTLDTNGQFITWEFNGAGSTIWSSALTNPDGSHFSIDRSQSITGVTPDTVTGNKQVNVLSTDGTTSGYDLTAAKLQLTSLTGTSGDDTLIAKITFETLTGNGGHDVMMGFLGGSTAFADTASHLTGATIQNFDATAAIDVRDLIPGAASIGFTQNNGSYGTLTISDGTHTAAMVVDGQFGTHGFYAHADGHGGTAAGYIDPSSPGYATFVAGHPGYTFG